MMTMKRFEAVIFDMDGVIVDSEPLHERAFLEVLEEIGYGQTHGIEFPAFYGKSDLVVWRDFIARHRPAQPLEELLARKEKKFGALLQQEEPIFSGLPELLAKLSPRCLRACLPACCFIGRARPPTSVSRWPRRHARPRPGPSRVCEQEVDATAERLRRAASDANERSPLVQELRME